MIRAISLAGGYAMGSVPWVTLAKLGAAVLIVAGAYAAGDRHRAKQDRLEAQAEVARQAQQQLAASEDARRIDNKRASVAQEVQTIYARKQESMARGNSGAAVELDGLRRQLAAVSAAASGAETTSRADAERIRVLTGLLAESAGLSEEGRRRVESLDARITGLQGWTEGVCVKQPEITPAR